MQTKEKKLTGYPSIDKPWLKYYDKEYLKQPLPEMTLYDYLKLRTEGYHNYTAFTYYGRKITYAELHSNIEATAKVLIDMGVKAGNRVMYLMPNIPETAYFLYAGAKIGAVADYIDPRPDSIDTLTSAKKVLSLFREELADYIVSLDMCYLGMIKPIERELKALGLEKIIIVSASDSMNQSAKMNYLLEKLQFDGLKALKESIKKTKSMATLMSEAKKTSCINLINYQTALLQSADVSVVNAPYIPNALAVIVHTSGTSNSKPKPIPLTHDNINVSAHSSLGTKIPYIPGNTELHLLPYFAAYGLVSNLHCALCGVHNLIEVPEFTVPNLGKIIKKTKSEMILGVPAWLLGLTKDKTLEKEDLSFIKMVTYGGDSMEIADEKAINDFLAAHGCKCVVTKGHGMSETCGGAAYAAAEYNKLGTMGIPMPHVTYALVNPESKELIKFENGQECIEGELIISSKVVTSGILDGRQIVPHREYNGEDYIYTCDIIQMDKNGVMTFLERIDRSFTRYDGYKIKPYEIENIIKQLPEVNYCVITPFEDVEKRGNMPMATVVLNATRQLSHKEEVEVVKRIINDCFVKNECVSSRQIPSRFRFRSSLPLSANGKVSFNEIIKEGLNGNEVVVELEESTISIGSIVIK